MRFLVVGDGYAGERIAVRVASLPGSELAAYATLKPPAGGRLALPVPVSESVEAANVRWLIRGEGRRWAAGLRADWLLCINSTVILPPSLIAAFEGRALNCHPGLLPHYGGLHAHQWAIRNGAREFGATVHVMEAAVDSGPIVAITRFPIRETDTGLSLFRTTMAHAVDLLSSVAARLAAGESLVFEQQDPAARRVYRGREALDGRIDWRLPARAVADFVRAGNYEPFQSPTYTAFFETPSGDRVEVLRCEPAGPVQTSPGTPVTLRGEGPLIACGDANAVCITRARDGEGVLDVGRWHRLLAST
jgi:methionyl-tRNA formyltransferase